MLVSNLYRILNQQQEGTVIRAELEVDPLHDIFKGHFPSVPVLPGVCMVQCVKEVLESALNKKTQLKKADMIKFLTMLNPQESTLIVTEIVIREQTDSEISFQASLKSNNQFLLKYTGSLYILN
ncbi:hydroxymyristoyl-ACP dehydratase [uncultured Cytophaga sp.]|uniref:hydroxymyristoyl-ACP dehydratase n=1 Tax=uncultured Cytophaga sp. TaxID=160238 RepID=UPI002633EC18|nr:hydroxymyristoyl-ACP dehydratase [uncultured Cytophaga sp.]